MHLDDAYMAALMEGRIELQQLGDKFVQSIDQIRIDQRHLLLELYHGGKRVAWADISKGADLQIDLPLEVRT